MTEVAGPPRKREFAGAGPPATGDWAKVATDAVEVHGALQKPAELAALLELVEQIQPRVIVEVGADAGGTLYAWSRLPGPPDVLAVDMPWGPHRRHTGLPELHGAGLVLGDSHDLRTLRQVREWLAGRRADVVFIDGDHTYEGVAGDWRNFKPIVAQNGLVVFHDILFHREWAVGVSQLWEEIQDRWPSTQIITEPLDWGGIGVVVNTTPLPRAPLRVRRRPGS